MSALKVITTNSSPALITTVYYGKNALSPSKLTCPTCPTEFTDGTNSANGGGCGYCQSTGANSSRLADEIFLEEYFRSTSSFSDPLKGIPFNEDAFRASNTLDQTNIKPIFSAESKLYGANDNFFGEWMLKMTNGDNQLRNIFVAENEHYAVWAPLRAPTSNENILAPGAYNWFTSSYLLRSFKNPPLFYTNAPICSTQTNSPLHVNYIGPREKNIQYHLRLTDVSNNIVNITSGYTPDFSLDQTTDFLADATSTLTVNGTNAPYTLTLELDYGNGTPVATYSEVIQVNSTLTITPIGYSTLNNISICDNKQVLLKASKFSNIDWYKDGIKVAQGSSSGEQYFNASESGSYYAIRTSGSTCLGQSNTVNLVGFDQSVFISPVCSTAAILKLNANYTSNVFNLGNLQYKWNTGETSQLIVIGTASDSRTFSVEISNSFDNCVAFDGITIPSGSFNSTSPTISASNLICNAGYGSVQLSVTGTEYPKTIVSDGVVNRFITWYGDPILPQTLTLLPPGHYQVTVTNNGNSCNDNTTFDIGTAVDFQNTANPSFTNVTCNGGSNGTAIFSALNTSLNLTFEWIGVPENSITKTNSSTTANNLPAGVYSLKIVETGTCNFQYINFTISQPTGFTSSATSNIIQCNGSATGAINQTVIPTPVSFSWSNSPVTEDISGLVAGTYSCTVTSSTGCSQTFQYNVDQNPAPTLTETHINVCIGGSNGSATVTAVNGMSPYTYLWLPSGGNAATANNLAAGSYSCRVTDVNGCQKNISVIISSSGTATVSAGPDQTVCGTTTTLAGSNPSPGSGTWSISVGAGGSFSNMNDPAATFPGLLEQFIL
ncbi:MAG: SprB repeat-containing protein [Bacteroidetes bacterium]|nr:SprB repeat-containing protein [Bacteroidota bacterium]